MGFAALYPSLYGALEVKRLAWRRTPFRRACQFLGSTEVFLRPDHDFAERRAQPLSRLAGTALLPHGALCPGHALTTASTARDLMGGTIYRAIDSKTRHDPGLGRE